MICEGREKLRPLKTEMAYQRPSSTWKGGVVGTSGQGDGRAIKEGLFQEPQDRQGTEKIPWLRNRV